LRFPIANRKTAGWAAVACFFAALDLQIAPVGAQTPEMIGRIEGEAFTARGNVVISRSAGVSVTGLLSGSEVTVAAGHARLTLGDGGEIDICGPAQFSVLKSGGAITLALSYGKVHLRVSAELPLQIFTAVVVATPVSVGGAPRDAIVGLDPGGELCVLAVHGAVRLENQFTTQRVLVPQLGEVSVPAGQVENLREATGACRCEIPDAPQAAAESSKPVAVPMPARREEKKEAAQQEVTPVYTAVMPPLTFSAGSPAPPPLPRAQQIKLFREMRVRPVTFSGRVEKAASAKAAGPEAAPAQTTVTPAEQPKPPGFGTRVANFFRRLFGRKPKT